MKRFLRTLATLALVAVTRPAEARLYNYEDLPIGSRGFGMGNTSLAITDDVGAITSNPGVLAWAEGDQISANVSAYARIDTRTGAYVSLFESAKDNIRRGGFVSVPALVGGFFKESRWSWGGAVTVPNSFLNSGVLDFQSNSRVSYDSLFEDTWVSAFGSYNFDDRNALGLSLIYVSRSSSEKFSYLDNTSGSTQIEFLERTWNSNGFSGVLGFSRKQTDQWTWGVSFRLPVVELGGTGTVSNLMAGATAFDSKDFKPTGYPMPMRLSAGAVYKWREGRTFAMDIHIYAPWKANLHPDNLSDFAVDLRWVPNLHMGYEHFFRKTLGLRVGFFTNLSAATDVPKGVSAIHDKVNMYGGTTSLVFARDTGEVSLGAWIQGGQGRAYSLDPTVMGDVPRSNYFYGGVIASSYRF